MIGNYADNYKNELLYFNFASSRLFCVGKTKIPSKYKQNRYLVISMSDCSGFKFKTLGKVNCFHFLKVYRKVVYLKSSFFNVMHAYGNVPLDFVSVLEFMIDCVCDILCLS